MDRPYAAIFFGSCRAAARGGRKLRRRFLVGALAFRREQGVQIDVDLARCPDVAHFKTVRCKTIVDQPDLFDADHLLPLVLK